MTAFDTSAKKTTGNWIDWGPEPIPNPHIPHSTLLAMNRPTEYRPNAIALTIAGSDPSGGAGLQADLKTFQQFGVYGASVVTMITAQNSLGVRRVENLSTELVLDQLDAVLDDIQPIVAKTGALGTAETIDAVHQRAQQFNFPLVVDPVMVSKHGDSLLTEDAVTDDAVAAYRRLLPKAFLVTPNRFELERLTGIALNTNQDVAKAIHDLHQMGARFVLAKMGEVNGQSEHILGSGKENIAIQSKRFETQNTHGAGCILSAAITALIALGETDLKRIVQRAIRQVSIGIHNTQPIGKGRSPVETRVLADEPTELTESTP